MAIVKYSRILARSVGWVMRVTDFQEKINCMLENSRKSYGYYWLKTVKLGKNVELGNFDFLPAKAGLLYNLLILWLEECAICAGNIFGFLKMLF